MKKILITMMFSMLIIGMYSTSAYADSEFENKYWGVDSSGYARYGHIILNGSDFQVFMVMLDNGEYQRFMPIVYSKNSQTITLNVKGDHTIGDLDIAKSLTDYYDEDYTLGCHELYNINNELDGYIYYLNSNFSIMEYMTMNYIEFETNGPKYYYFESGADLYSSDTYVKALNSVLGGGLSDFTITDGNISKNNDDIVDIPTPINACVRHTDKMNRWEFDVCWQIPDMDINIKNDLMVEMNVQSFWSSRETLTFDWYEDCTYYHIPNDYIKAINYKYRYDLRKDNEVIEQIKNNCEWTKPSIITTSLGINHNEFIVDLMNKETPFRQFKKTSYPSFMFRFYYIDDNGVKHVSNYVKLQDSGHCEDYVANEVISDGTIVDGSLIGGGNVDNSSGLYDGTSSSLSDSDLLNTDTLMPTSYIRLLLNDVKEFPDFVNQVFGFLPINLGYVLGLLVVIVMALGVFRKLVGG